MPDFKQDGTGPLQPTRIRIGAAGWFIRIDALAREMGITEDTFVRLLGAMGPNPIPLIRFPGRPARYVLLYALESRLFELGLPADMKDSPFLSRTHQELAGIMYGAISRRVIQDRVLAMARILKDGSTPKKSKGSRRK